MRRRALVAVRAVPPCRSNAYHAGGGHGCVCGVCGGWGKGGQAGTCLSGCHLQCCGHILDLFSILFLILTFSPTGTAILPDGSACPRYDSFCGSADSIGSRVRQLRQCF